MKIHPRLNIVQTANFKLNEEVWKIANEYDLTYTEIESILISQMYHFNRYMLRMERHPEDPNKKADEK